jgi:hypothetical protein
MLLDIYQSGPGVIMKGQTKAKPKAAEDRSIAFRAPNQIHGAIKQIVGKLEMDNVTIDGRVPYERDLINWLIGELYAEGPSNWASRIRDAKRKFETVVSPN